MKVQTQTTTAYCRILPTLDQPRLRYLFQVVQTQTTAVYSKILHTFLDTVTKFAFTLLFNELHIKIFTIKLQNSENKPEFNNFTNVQSTNVYTHIFHTVVRLLQK